MMTNKPLPEFLQDFIQKENNAIQQNILEYVYQRNSMFQGDQLFLEMKEQGIKISYSTLYAKLRKLTNAGILEKLVYDDRRASYYKLLHINPPHCPREGLQRLD